MRIESRALPALAASLALSLGCGSSSSGEELNAGAPGTATGGTSPSGGVSGGPTGGTMAGATGGASPSGGSPGAGSGGQDATGGTPSSGGSPSGGDQAGGAPASGGSDAGSGASPEAGSGGAPDLDPAPGEYGERADLLDENSEMAVAEVGGKIYVLGGYPSSPAQSQVTVAVYDPALESWEYSEPLPEPIHHPVAMGALGKLYSLGGQTPGEDTDRTLVFDPAEPDLGWQDLAPMPTARGAGAGALIDDRIYVVGGRPPAQNQLEVYDIGDDQWSELPNLPSTFNQRNHLAAAAIGGKVYVAGGRYDGGGFGSPRTASLDIYDPATNEWSLGTEMLRPRGGVNGIAAYGCFFVWGGEGQNIGEPNDVFPDHDSYDPRTDEWTALDPLPTPIHGVTGAAFIDGLIYMPGGGTSSGGSSGTVLFQVYRPAVRCE